MQGLKLLVGAIVITLITGYAGAQETLRSRLDVPYVPTAEKVIDAMLKLAKVKQSDTVYDLGCGDGRIVITAAKQYGANGVGIDIDPQRVKEANENAKNAGVFGRVKFIEGDLFKADISRATVVTLYLSQGANLKLRQTMLKQLKPGTRIVSHAFDMGGWKPEQTIKVVGSTVHLWTVTGKDLEFTKY
jgi:precorrin-6B methylase 2